MTRKVLIYLLASFLLAASGCSRPSQNRGRAIEPYLPDSGSVVFDIKAFTEQNGSIRLEAIHSSPGKVAKFALEFGPEHNVESKDLKDFPLATGQGRFLSEPGSDATDLLADLKKALEAKTVPANARRVKELPFSFVNLGDSLSQAPGGGFNENPPGGWTAMKIFIGEGDQEAEVLVNFNPTIGKGQFSIKDADYGDLVLKQLATVL